jgi:hypothetical protein
MTAIGPRRAAFTPEVLAIFDHTMDEVWEELLADHVFSCLVLEEDLMRARVAQKLITFASSGRTDSQIKQLLLRKFHNEVSAARYEHSQIKLPIEPTRIAWREVDQSAPNNISDQ